MDKLNQYSSFLFNIRGEGNKLIDCFGGIKI